MKKRLLSLTLALALCLTLLPAAALAASPGYLALGDSITTGYAPGVCRALASTPPESTLPDAGDTVL